MQNQRPVETMKPHIHKKRPPIENLVLEGAGVKGGCYAGAFTALEERGVLKQVKRVGGSSAGAIGALLLAIGNNANDISEKLTAMDFTTFLDPRKPEKNHKEKLINKEMLSVAKAARKSPLKGVFKGDAFVSWTKDEIRNALGKVAGFQEWLDAHRRVSQHADIAEVTYSELHEYIAAHPKSPLKDLYVTATDITADASVVLSHESTPNTPLWVGVRMSMSFPSAFEAVSYDLYNSGQPHLYVDGGLAENYPASMFNHVQYAPDGFEGFFRRFGHNLGTVGIKIDSVHECARLFWNIKSYSNLEDLTVRASDEGVSIRVAKDKPPFNEYHRNELCIYDISQVVDPTASESEQKNQENTGIYKLKYVVKHVAKDKEGKEVIEEIQGEILQGDGDGQLSLAHMHYLQRNKDKFPTLFDASLDKLSQIGRNAVNKLLEITTERRHTPQKKIASVESSGNKIERMAIGALYGKTIRSQQKQGEEEKKINQLYSHQTIQIYDTGVDTLQFDISFREKRAMYTSGYTAASQFLDNYMDGYLPQDVLTDPIEMRAKDKTIEELVELIEEYDAYIIAANESKSDIYPLEEYEKEKSYLHSLVISRVIFELNEIMKNPGAPFPKTSFFMAHPANITPNRLRIMESVRYILNFQASVEAQKLNALVQQYIQFIETNRSTLSNYAEVPPNTKVLLSTSPADWIFNTADLQSKHPEIDNSLKSFAKNLQTSRQSLSAMIHLEKTVSARITNVHGYRQFRAQSGLFGAAPQAAPAASPKMDASTEEVKVHVSKPSKGGS